MIGSAFQLNRAPSEIRKQCLFRTLILLLLQSAAFPVTTESPVLSCDGPYRHLTYCDCQGIYYNTSGCYLHFVQNITTQYRPCYEVCNGVVAGSNNEYKCQDYCPGE